MSLPLAYKPAEVARQLGWSERHVRDLAKRLGACRILGNRMVLLPQDVDVILEATKCPSPSTSAAMSGITGGRLPAGDYEALVKQRKKPLRRVRLPKSKLNSGNVILMGRDQS